VSGTTRQPLGAKDAALIAVVSVAWAGNFFFSKLALRELPPLTYTALRLGLLGIVLLGDRPGTRMLVGGVMVLAGVLALSVLPAATARAT
jgi:drug/metabolite transporter (DMT)-like permease